ncbi:MAG: hypothetical protein AAGJ08_18570 [Cyanobacteria bacterium P01_H01_bin.35]
MEPITIVMALAAVLGTKALEKTGENIGQVVWDKSSKLMKYLKQESPSAIAAIEQASEQPLDYGQAVLEMQEAAANPDVAQTIQELAAAVEENPHPKLTEVVEEIREALKSQQSSIHNENKSKLQEKGFINQGVQHIQGGQNLAD